MLFYVVLLVVSLTVATACVWAFRRLSSDAASGYRTFSKASRRRKQARLAHLNSNLESAPSPWGWSAGSVKRAGSRTFVGGKGHIGEAASASARNVLTGYDLQPTSQETPDTVTDTSSWPYRDDNFYSSRLTATRSGRLEKTSGARPQPDERPRNKKPWGW